MTDCGDLTNNIYLTFIYRYKSNEFGYTKKLTDNSHKNLHDTISKLKHEGLGYRKISKKLNELGIKSHQGHDFYPPLVSNIWRKLRVKEELLNQPVIREYKDFDLLFIKLKCD